MARTDIENNTFPAGYKSSSLCRILKLLPLLLESPRSQEEIPALLAEELARSGWDDALPSFGRSQDPTSTVARDIRLIKDLDLLRFSPKRKYEVSPTPNLPLMVTPQEAQALELAALALDQLGLPEAESIQEIIGRIPARLRGNGLHHAIDLAPSLRGIDQGIWRELHRGIEGGKCLRLSYQKPGEEPRDVVVDRSRLLWLTGTFSLCAFRPDLARANPELPAYEHLREYRIDRIRKVSVLSDAVTIDALPMLRCVFVLDQEIRDRLFELRNGDGKTIQRVFPLENGHTRIETLEYGLLRARQHLSIFGHHLVSIEEPAALRETMAKSFRSLCERFSN